jgi:hypothetical protein
VIVDSPSRVKGLLKGTVKTIRLVGDIGVEFDDWMGGHTGSWEGKGGHCWYCLLDKVKIDEAGNVKEILSRYL